MRRIFLAALLLLIALSPMAEAGHVGVVVHSTCTMSSLSASADARSVAVATCDGSLFFVDRNAGTIVLISHASGSATTPANGASRFPVLSADGAVIAFRSTATDLVPGQTDSPGTDNVFLYNTATGQNTLISQRQSPGGPTADFFPEIPSISADGRYVAFDSDAGNLVAGQADVQPTADTPGTKDIFLYDRVAGTLVLVSHAANFPANAANSGSDQPVLSADGGYVLFLSHATNLIVGSDTNGQEDLFLYDRAGGTTVLVSRASASPTTAGAGFSFGKAISADGRYVAFSSNAGNLVSGQVDPVTTLDVFLFDRVTGTTALVSHKVGIPATAGSGNSGRPSISAAGRYIAFDSEANDLAAGTTDPSAATPDTFVYDRVSGTAVLVSHAPGAPNVSATSSFGPKISADGSSVAFIGYASHLVGETNTSGMPDLFLFDRLSGAIVLATRSYLSPLQDANDGFYAAPDEWFLSANGSHIVFPSNATDLVGDDEPGQDVYDFDNGLRGRFFTLTPCRYLDTRRPGDGGPLASGVILAPLSVYHLCGVAMTAKALAVNVTATQSTGPGHLRLWAGDAAAPETSIVNFATGQTRANNAILLLASNAEGTMKISPVVSGGGTVHVIIDILGYFE